MKKNFYYPLSVFAIIGFLTILSTNKEIHATDPHDAPPSFEESFSEGGYKSVEEAIKEFENYYQYDVKLPKIVPKVSFTHQFGRFNEDKNFNRNSALEIKFVNEKIRENIYKLEIRSLTNKLNYKGEVVTLKDESEGVYFESHQFNFFAFEKNNLQYLLGIHKDISDKNTPSMLTEIANSLN